MSTTVVVALIVGSTLYVAHVGDSRAYLYRNQSVHLLTRDHTYAEEMIQQGKLVRAEAKQKTNRNVLTRYLGPGPIPKVDLTLISPDENQQLPDQLNLLPGDAILLCSDGLTDKVTEAEISHILTQNQRHVQKSTDQLIQKALEKHESDNITAVLFRSPCQGEARQFSRTLLWLAGLFLLTLLVVFAITQLTTFLPSTQVPESATSIQLTSTVGTVLAQSQTSVSTSTPSPTMIPDITNTPVQPTKTPFLTSSPLQSFQKPQKNQLRLAATKTPIPTPTSTPIPTFTSTSTPTLSSPAIVNQEGITTTSVQENPIEGSPAISPSTQISPALMAITIELVSPEDKATITEEQTLFKWTTNITNTLPPNYAFELIFWEDEQDPLKQGKGLIGTADTSLDGATVNWTNHKVLTKAGTYLWGVRIVKLMPYEEIRFLEKQRTFVFKP